MHVDAKARERVDSGGFFVYPSALAYAIAREVEAYRQERGDSAQTHIDVFGALEQVKLEYQRKVVVPQEDPKMVKNGRVFGPSPAPPKSCGPITSGCRSGTCGVCVG